MSLKAKLEAVIYASEEPVTLAQLAALFADEALELKAEQEKAEAEAAASKSASAAEPLLMLNRAFSYLEVQQGGLAPVESVETGELAVELEETASLEPAAEPAVEAERGNDAGAGALLETPADAVSESQSAESIVATEDSSAEEGDETQAAVESSGAETPAEAAEEPAADGEPELSPEEAAKQAARQRDREVRVVIRMLLDELVEEYETDARGIEIREIAGGYRMATKPEYHDSVRMFIKSLKPALKLSLPALETLAVIAYKQPVTAPEVNEIRGVDSSGVFGSLLARKLISTAGRKQVVGRPILYKTTKEFLLRFGLKDLNELPSMEEFEKMAASELEEAEIPGMEPEAPAAAETAQENAAENAGETVAAETAPEAEAAPAPQDAAPATEDAAAEAPQTALE